MTERVSSNSTLQQQINDFMERTLTDEEFNAVKEAGKEGGKISLDDDGKLVVLRPDAHRDNWFVRFFKGLFKGDEYKTEQRLLDKVPQLAANKTFSEALQKSFANYVMQHAETTNNYGHMQSAFNYSRVVTGMLDTYAKPGKEITAGDLRQALKNSELMTGTRLAQAKDQASDDKQIYSANIYFHGRMMTAREFAVKRIMEAEHEQETQGAQNQDEQVQIKTEQELRQWAENQISDEEDIVTALNNHFMKDPNSLKDFLPQKDIDRMCVLSGGKDWLNGPKGKEYATLLAKATTNFYSKVGEYAQKRLMQGDAPQQVACGIKDIFQSCGKSQTSQSFVSEIRQLLEVKAPVISENIELAQREMAALNAQKAASLHPELQMNAKINDIKQYAENLHIGYLSDNAAARILYYCEKSGQDPHYFLQCGAQFYSSVKELSKTVGRELSNAEPMEVYKKLSDLLNTLQEKVGNAKRAMHANDRGYKPEIGMADNVTALTNAMMFIGFTDGSSSLESGLFRYPELFEDSYHLFKNAAIKQGISSGYQQCCSNGAALMQILTESIKSSCFDLMGHYPDVVTKDGNDSSADYESDFVGQTIIPNYMRSNEVKSLIDLFRSTLSFRETRIFDEALANYQQDGYGLTECKLDRIGFSLGDLDKLQLPSNLREESDKVLYIQSLNFDSMIASMIKSFYMDAIR